MHHDLLLTSLGNSVPKSKLTVNSTFGAWVNGAHLTTLSQDWEAFLPLTTHATLRHLLSARASTYLLLRT